MILFLLIFFIARPISYEELSQTKRNRDSKTEYSKINLLVQDPVRRSQINKPLSEYDSLMGRENDLILAAFRGKRKKFDLAFHRRLEQHFPDWEDRINYQKKQEEFSKSALRKERELRRLRIKDTSKFYTKQELDAIDYFHGTGSYKKYQDPAMKPNIFDTRQTFLFQMHDRTRLLEF